MQEAIGQLEQKDRSHHHCCACFACHLHAAGDICALWNQTSCNELTSGLRCCWNVYVTTTVDRCMCILLWSSLIVVLADDFYIYLDDDSGHVQGELCTLITHLL